jgi:23S rRNA (cytosine1962-C5)-methyltransferase
VKITENGLHFLVDVCAGQKTGFYLDQRENRRLVAQYAEGRDILDCFCYTGAFSIHAARAGAKSITLVDTSAVSLDLARKNLELNQLSTERAEFVTANAFQMLRDFREAGRRFDMVILDPPKFAATRSHLTKALEGYKDVNMCGMNLLNPGGLLVTFSCSSAVDIASFKTAVAWAAHDVTRPVQILHVLSQPPDHPCLASFPESEYLKGFICRVL